MKKVISAFLAALLLAALLSGCHGARDQGTFAIPETFDESRSYEITFWAKNDTNVTQANIYKQAIADFQELYPSITVNLRLYTDYSRIYNDVITNIATNTTFWKPQIDGMRMDFKGEQQIDNAECKMSGTLVELTASNFKDVLALADNTTSGNITTIQPRFSITDDDYIDHIIWVGDHGSDGLYLVDLKNALNTSGLNMQTTDKDIATLPFEFTGHADSVSSTTLPITIKLFSKAAAGQGG